MRMSQPVSLSLAGRRGLVLILTPSLAVFILAVWITYVQLWQIPSYMLPHPFRVVAMIWQLSITGLLFRHALFTLQAVAAGFALGTSAAIVIGTLISRSRFLETLLRPYIIASQTTPVLVLAPLFLVWFGFGLTSKMLIAAIMCFFPLLVNVILGLRSVGENELKLMRSFKASGWQIFVKLEVPHALPYIFAGVRITCLLSVIGAVVGEFVGSKAGLGYLAITAAGNLNTDMLFSAVFSLMVIGISFYTLVSLIEKRVLFWHASTNR